jgi:hypothetical protein
MKSKRPINETMATVEQISKSQLRKIIGGDVGAPPQVNNNNGMPDHIVLNGFDANGYPIYFNLHTGTPVGGGGGAVPPPPFKPSASTPNFPSGGNRTGCMGSP